MTYDNSFVASEIPFPTRVGHNFKTLTKNRLRNFLRLARKITRYHFEAWNFQVYNLKELTKDLSIIHSADFWYPYTAQAVKTGIPTIVTEWENIPFNFEQLPYRKIKKYNRQHVAHFVAITEKAKEALKLEGVDAERISVIPAGIDCDHFKPKEKDFRIIERFNLSMDTRKVLFVGRLVPEKGIFILLKAFASLIKKTGDVELLIVGSGSEKTKIEIARHLAALRIGDKVKFLGSIKYREMPEIHNLADIFCLPSLETKTWAEQFGYSMVEAMSCGKPVVSTWTGAIPEVVKHRETGILVKPNDSNELCFALEELLVNNQERHAYGGNAREWVLKRFEANDIANQLADIYRKYV